MYIDVYSNVYSNVCILMCVYIKEEEVALKIAALSGEVPAKRTTAGLLASPHVIFDPKTEHLKNSTLAKLE